jgi:hypothetical protein
MQRNWRSVPINRLRLHPAWCRLHDTRRGALPVSAVPRRIVEALERRNLPTWNGSSVVSRAKASHRGRSSPVSTGSLRLHFAVGVLAVAAGQIGALPNITASYGHAEFQQGGQFRPPSSPHKFVCEPGLDESCNRPVPTPAPPTGRTASSDAEVVYPCCIVHFGCGAMARGRITRSLVSH